MATPEGVLRPLPRRPPPPEADLGLPVHQTLALPRPSLLRTALRSLRWNLAGTRFGARVAWDQLRGERSTRQVGARLRATFEEVGGPAIKLGQQLSIRMDLLPFDLCMELSRLTDRVPPFPTAEAIAEVERAIGGPLHTVFSAFDPKPVGSASIACVYKAVLHSGEVVAVKVQRPLVAEQFVSDIAAISLLTRTMEAFALVRSGFFRFLREELSAMFLEELDFTIEARYQALFRQYAERDRLDWVTSPRLWRRWCTSRVMVSEFVPGVPCTEVVRVADTQDRTALDKLAAVDIDPKVVGSHIFALALWGRFEMPFMHGDPHPANLLVLPGNKLVMLDFGACTPMSRKTTVLHRHYVHHMTHDQISEMSHTSLADIAPLPPIDIESFRRALEHRTRWFQHALRDPHSPWYERSSAALWVYMLDVVQEHQVPVNLDALRMARMLLLSDTLAFRLHPDLSLEDTARYLREAPERLSRRLETRGKQSRRGSRLVHLHEAEQVLAQLRAGLFRAEALQGLFRSSTEQLIGKGAMIVSWMLSVGLLAVTVGTVQTAVWAGWVPEAERLVGWAEGLTSPGGMLVWAILLAWSGQQLRRRLGDVERA
jgi:ubiquinone biosynthesis protein